VTNSAKGEKVKDKLLILPAAHNNPKPCQQFRSLFSWLPIGLFKGQIIQIF